MKLLNLKIMNKKRLKDQLYLLVILEKNLIKLELLSFSNLIRRILLKEIYNFKVSTISIFLFNSNKFCYKIHEFTKVEEVKNNLVSFLILLKEIKFRSYYKLKTKRTFALLKIKQFTQVFLTDIILPNNFKILSIDNNLIKLNSLDINLKVLLELHKSKGYNFNPVKKVNYIEENNVYFEIYTNQTSTPLEVLVKSLKIIKLETYLAI
uniref:DNA-directed RNA polymerase subunit alpha n=1 Tax=Euglena myxocylindracea TaxID=38276 RepID=RPOA_EUGMY|nr:RecName: Full=DNA-directed RNA polymerase subunit alpha; Short=PEP; AltName: Full=Plastid-encoded RNA polymerase subunit alpha; Short=RNA polymerase subunit alpha [Euglena myxocylindracea]AAL83364.1 RNA polymerase alpha subunit [Euglena myxocylindracea]